MTIEFSTHVNLFYPRIVILALKNDNEWKNVQKKVGNTISDKKPSIMRRQNCSKKDKSKDILWNNQKQLQLWFLQINLKKSNIFNIMVVIGVNFNVTCGQIRAEHVTILYDYVCQGYVTLHWETDKNSPAGHSGIRVCQRMRDFARIFPRVSRRWSDEETVLSTIHSISKKYFK